MPEDDPLHLVVEATLHRMTAQQDAAQWLARRREGIWRMYHEQHLSPARIANEIRDALRAAGVSAEQLEDAGVSVYSVEKIVKGPRPA